MGVSLGSEEHTRPRAPNMPPPAGAPEKRGWGRSGVYTHAAPPELRPQLLFLPLKSSLLQILFSTCYKILLGLVQYLTFF